VQYTDAEAHNAVEAFAAGEEITLDEPVDAPAS
jgi:hypothetical protein